MHGDATGFAYAVQTDRFVVQLGDLVDGGPDSDGALRLMWQLIDEGRGLFLLGNHDLRLRRALVGESPRVAAETAETVASLSPAQRARAAAEIARAPAWLVHGPVVFVHGGFHTEMLEVPPSALPDGRPFGAVARALYGEPTGRTQPDGFPHRSLAWVDRIPEGITVYCGHDRRSMNGRPLEKHGRRGGTAIFLDTGAGKGGHLSWLDIDLDPDTLP